MSKPKYKIGERMDSLDELLECEFIYFVTRPKDKAKIIHNGFFQSWKFRFVCNQLYGGRLYKAIRIEENENENENL